MLLGPPASHPLNPAPRAKRIYLLLGSNVGDRVGHLQQALALLPGVGVEVRRVSSLYRTQPVDFTAPRWFVNCAVEAATSLLPLPLLKALKGLERRLGRRASAAKGPRPIDIDILLYENLIIRSRALTVPHPRMSERRFVLIPLRELAAHLRHPVTERTVVEMLKATADRSAVVRLHPAAGAGVSSP